MRKKMKKDLFCTFQTIGKAEQTISDKLIAADTENILGLLSSLQETIINIGKEIEDSEAPLSDSVKRIISDLENYCELLWQISISCHEPSSKNICRDLSEIRSDILEGLKRLPDTIEVAFFPYKSSMWDSLESVWMYYKDQPDFSVFVVPIPYYDVGIADTYEHYEGNEFPDYVPITDWREYNIQKRKPDIAFIHNPYDDTNTITSVHPDFYASNLKKCTNLLVYIPYFVLGDEIYPHFCVCPGTIYADIVIVQSQAVRKHYITAFKEWVTENGLEDIFDSHAIEKKFWASGSPKTDKLFSLQSKETALPDKWASRINGKTVVLYNTNVTGLLVGNELALKKIEDVIDYFRFQKDALLWWRPHPLSNDTCKTMRPQLLEKYVSLIDEYKKSSIGIFDETPDFYRALLTSDLYYGDDSSLVYLYGLLGKPILMQNIDIQFCSQSSISADKSIFVMDCFVDDQDNSVLWFTAENMNGLYRMDLKLHKCDFMGTIPGEDVHGAQLYRKIIKDKSDLWLIPYRAKELARYDTEKNSFYKYRLPEGTETKSRKFYSACIYENKLYMIPENYCGILIFDLLSRHMHLETSWLKLGEQICGQPLEMPYFFGSICIAKHKLYLVMCNSNIIVTYDFLQNVFHCFQIDGITGRFSHIAYDGTDFWIASRTEHKVVRLDQNLKLKFIYTDFPADFVSVMMFEAISFTNGYLFLLPIQGNMVMRINSQSGVISSFFTSENDRTCFSFIKSLHTNHFLIGTNINGTFCQGCLVDSEGTQTDAYPFRLPDALNKSVKNVFESITNAGFFKAGEYILWESRDLTIKDLLDAITKYPIPSEEQKNKFSKLFVNPFGNAGETMAKKIEAYYEDII